MVGVSEHYTDYDTRLAAYAVIVRAGGGTDAATAGPDDGEQVLLAFWNDGSRWTLPGGGVDLYETPDEGAVREVREETGYDVELTGLLGIETDVIPRSGRAKEEHRHRDLKAVRVFYAARIVGGELTHESVTNPGGSTDEARWFDLTEVAGLERTSMVDTGLGLRG